MMQDQTQLDRYNYLWVYRFTIGIYINNIFENTRIHNTCTRPTPWIIIVYRLIFVRGMTLELTET